MKKVLFVVDEKQMGGVSIVLEDILKSIDKSKSQIDLLILHPVGDCLNKLDGINIIYGSSFYEVVDQGLKDVIKSHNIKLLVKKIYLIFLLKTGLIKQKIAKTRKEFLKDVYDVEIAFKDGFCTIFTAYGDSLKKVTWLHTDYSNNNPARNYQKTYNDSLEKLDEVIAISKDISKKFNAIYKCEKKTKIIYNYIDKEKVLVFAKEKITDLKLSKDLNIVALGRLHPIKGYDRLINIFGKLKEEKVLGNTKLFLIGDGPEKGRLVEQIKELNLEENIVLLGQKKNPYSYLKKADALILSSWSEAYPLVVVESLILNVPVISVEFSSVREMLEHKKNGYIIKNNNDALYKGLKNLIKKPEILGTMKINIKKEKYDNKEIIKQIEDLWS